MGNLIFWIGTILSFVAALVWWMLTGHFPNKAFGEAVLGLLFAVSASEISMYFAGLREDVKETRERVAALQDEIASLRESIEMNSAFGELR